MGVSVVIKNKTLRLRWPEEVDSERAKAERSKLTGELVVTACKTDEKAVGKAKREKERHDAEEKEAKKKEKEAKEARRKKNWVTRFWRQVRRPCPSQAL